MKKLKVMDEVERLLSFWFPYNGNENKSLWFVSNPKAKEELNLKIYKEFGELLGLAERGELDWMASAEARLACIILLDQFSRHVYRMDGNENNESKIDDNTAKAAEICKQSIKDEMIYDLTEEAKLSFFLMPLRHIKPKTKENFDLILKVIDKFEEKKRIDQLTLSKFKEATIKNIPTDNENKDIFKYNGEIREVDNIEDDLNNLQKKNPLIKAIRNFVKLELNLNQIESPVFCLVSLSGGVDSMVIASLLKYAFPKSKPVAVHINYGNRKVSDMEADFLRKWCKENGIYLYVKDIPPHLRRNSTNREVYEIETRKIRFEFYKETIKKHFELLTKDSNNTSFDYNKIGVILGHHKGDVQENVISNTMKGLSIFQLSGMRKVQVMDLGIPVWRPLLDFDKEHIFNYAHKYGIPYFQDTTPLWSIRGQLRRDLLPMFEKIYGIGFKKNLTNMAHKSDELDVLAQKSIFGPFYENKVKKINCGVLIDILNYEDFPEFFFREIFKFASNKIMGLGQPSLSTFFKRLRSIIQQRKAYLENHDTLPHPAEICQTGLKKFHLCGKDDKYESEPSKPYQFIKLSLRHESETYFINNRFILWYHPMKEIPKDLILECKDPNQEYSFNVVNYKIDISKAEEYTEIKSNPTDDWKFLTSNSLEYSEFSSESYKIATGQTLKDIKFFKKWSAFVKNHLPIITLKTNPDYAMIRRIRITQLPH
jgi:tRNA(Ile)-lysidine synthetase-like protein